MNASNRFTFCAIALSAGLLIASTANAGNSGGSHAVSAQQQKSVRQSADFTPNKISAAQQRSVRHSADIKLPNKPPASRKLQKRDATAVKTPANKQLEQDFTKAADQKRRDDINKEKQEKAKALNDANQKAKEHGLENKDVQAEQQAQQRKDDQNALSDPIGYVEKQIQDGTTSHGSQPNRSDNFVQDANDFAKAASDSARTDNVSQDVKGFAKAAAGAAGGVDNGHGFGEMTKGAMDKATKDNTPARLRQCANC
jgi:hypothetical protein